MGRIQPTFIGVAGYNPFTKYHGHPSKDPYLPTSIMESKSVFFRGSVGYYAIPSGKQMTQLQSIAHGGYFFFGQLIT